MPWRQPRILLAVGICPQTTLAATVNRGLISPARHNIRHMRHASGTGLGINIMKDGEEPKILPDDEYPEWLKALAYPPETLGELRAMDIEEMSETQRKRYWKLHKRAKIKAQNEIARVSEF